MEAQHWATTSFTFLRVTGVNLPSLMQSRSTGRDWQRRYDSLQTAVKRETAGNCAEHLVLAPTAVLAPRAVLAQMALINRRSAAFVTVRPAEFDFRAPGRFSQRGRQRTMQFPACPANAKSENLRFREAGWRPFTRPQVPIFRFRAVPRVYWKVCKKKFPPRKEFRISEGVPWATFS